MRMKKWTIALTMAGGLVGVVHAAPVLDANFQGPFLGNAFNTSLYRAQTFTVLRTGQLTRFEAALTGAGTSLFEIWNVSAGAPVAIPGTALASATLSFSGAAFVGADISSFNLDVTAGEVLALVQIGGTSTGSGSWRFDLGTTYSGGGAYTATVSAPNAWSLLSGQPNSDYGFKVFVDNTVPEPGTLALVSLALLGLSGARRRLDGPRCSS